MGCSCEAVGQYSADAQSATAEDLLWFVEDDILVPIDACQRLFSEISAEKKPAIGVSGSYHNRHVASRMLGGWLQDGKRFEPPDFPLLYRGLILWELGA